MFKITLIIVALLAVMTTIFCRKQQESTGAAPAPESAAASERVTAPPESIMEVLTEQRLWSLHFTPSKRQGISRWQSKFGGTPYWPNSLPYPRTPDGKPLYMLAQLNLSEMPPLPGYPETGMLQFFIADMYESLKYGETLEERIRLNSDGSTARVVYHSEIIDAPTQLAAGVPHAGEIDALPLSDEYALYPALIEELPAPSDHRFQHVTEGFDIDDELLDVLWRTFSAEGSKLGGYAHFAQTDPRHSLESDEWLLLFQLDTSTDPSVDIMWGDGGVGNWFIRRDDLATRDFSRVWFHWDSH